MTSERAGRAVMITGASTGIGRACALRLDEAGARVFAGVRNESDGDALKRNASDALTPVLIDVTLPETIASARDTVAEAISDAGLAGLVNNAGVFYGGPLEFAPLDELRQLFEVNFFGVVSVTQAFLPLLRKAKGRLVNMSSVSGLFAFPFLGPYASSKHALEALTDSWRLELRPWGIKVSLVEPGEVDTPIFDKGLETLRKARETYPAEARELYGPVFGLAEQQERRMIPPERVAKVVEHAIFARNPKRRYLVGPDARLITIFGKIPLALREWLIARQFPKYGEA